VSAAGERLVRAGGWSAPVPHPCVCTYVCKLAGPRPRELAREWQSDDITMRSRQAHLRPANRVHGRDRPLDAAADRLLPLKTASCVHSFAYVPEFTFPASEAHISSRRPDCKARGGIKTIFFTNLRSQPACSVLKSNCHTKYCCEKTLLLLLCAFSKPLFAPFRILSSYRFGKVTFFCSPWYVPQGTIWSEAMRKWKDEVRLMQKCGRAAKRWRRTCCPWPPVTITLLSLPAQGNARYRRGDLEGALGAYSVGVDTEGSSSERVALLSNRSACLCDLGRWEEALADARRCVLVGPKP
jgi:hypothetical protein